MPCNSAQGKPSDNQLSSSEACDMSQEPAVRLQWGTNSRVVAAHIYEYTLTICAVFADSSVRCRQGVGGARGPAW